MVVFDASFLIYLLDPKIIGGTGTNSRIDFLVSELAEAGERIIVPAPALCEVLVGAGNAGPKYLEILARSRYFRIAEFGERAAIEAAVQTREALASGDKRGPTPDSDWGKVKFDRQIVAIAKVLEATIIYTDDAQLSKHAEAVGIAAINFATLPLPPEQPQLELKLDPIEPEIPDDEND
jgi:predicted nucleic acid-binding protein